MAAILVGGTLLATTSGPSTTAYAQSQTAGTPYEQAFSAYQNQKFLDAENTWTELANGGDVNAQYALGVMHLRREASDSSAAVAFSWFEKAAKQGHATAMFNLGVAYWEGTGVDQDRKKALTLWQEAADKGDSGAQFNLGLAYYIGEERAADIEQAKAWISKAAAQNHPEASRILKVIDSEMLAQEQASDQVTSVVAVNESTAATPAPTEAEIGKYWKTMGDQTTIYNKPDGIGFRKLPPGTPLEINGQDGGWARITVPDGLRTWVFSKFINVDGDRGVINADAVRVRPEPSTDDAISPSLGQYRRGDSVSVIGKQGDWIQIRAPKKISAWIEVSDIIEYRDTEDNRAAAWQQAQENGA